MQSRSELLRLALGRASTAVWDELSAEPEVVFAELFAACATKHDRDLLVTAIRKHLGSHSEAAVSEIMGKFEAVCQEHDVDASLRRLDEAVNSAKLYEIPEKEINAEDLLLASNPPQAAIDAEIARLRDIEKEAENETERLVAELQRLENERVAKLSTLQARSHDVQSVLEETSGWPGSEQQRWTEHEVVMNQ